MIIAAAAIGLAIGAILGGLGGGGAILTVPALVYVLGQSGQDATTSSLVIVGVTSVVGAINYARSGQVRWRTGIGFGVAGIAAAFAGTALNRQVEESVLLLAFAALMIAAAVGMLVRSYRERHPRPGHAPADEPAGEPHAAGARHAQSSPATATLTRPGATRTHAVRLRTRRTRATLVAKIIVAGLAVGFLTGFFGVGGGFIIVPALVLVLGLPMTAAVGTSLVVIAVNSASALGARAGQGEFTWEIIIPFTIAAVAGSFAGKIIADRLPSSILDRVFAVLLIAVAVYTASTSLVALP